MKDEKLHKAKRQALENLKEAMDKMSDGGMMSAKVVAKDEEGLTKGLEKAHEMMEEREDEDGDDDTKESLLKFLKER